MRNIPDNVGDKNSATAEATWSEYQANRSKDNLPEMHDCTLNEAKNWYGNSRCKEEWECQGARVCEFMSYGADGVAGIGWCRGPTACPLVGPLDKYDPNSRQAKLNPGSQPRTDIEEWDLAGPGTF